MDQEQAAPDNVAELPTGQGFDPNHYWAVPESRIDMTAVKPHTCMVRVKQIGNHIHCYDGNHGIRLAPDEMLVGLDANGERITSKNRGTAVKFDIVKITPEESPKIPKAMQPKPLRKLPPGPKKAVKKSSPAVHNGDDDHAPADPSVAPDA